jgi:hypothetical protein
MTREITERPDSAPTTRRQLLPSRQQFLPSPQQFLPSRQYLPSRHFLSSLQQGKSRKIWMFLKNLKTLCHRENRVGHSFQGDFIRCYTGSNFGHVEPMSRSSWTWNYNFHYILQVIIRRQQANARVRSPVQSIFQVVLPLVYTCLYSTLSVLVQWI